MSGLYGPGETATAYAAAADLFAQRMIWLGRLFSSNPHLRAAEAIIKPASIDIVTMGFNGVMKDWDHALPPLVVRGSGFFPIQSGLGVEDTLKTGVCTVHIRHLGGV